MKSWVQVQALLLTLQWVSAEDDEECGPRRDEAGMHESIQNSRIKRVAI